ncbi:MAG: O-methyltransferase, partial [Candidatus Eisenbacteria bacterium]|nr:O-methyltransferase [Candidatus Eisenbacteria bacterium]
IGQYLADLHQISDPVIEEMETTARRRHFPIVGSAVGRLLEISARLVNPRNVLELGSGFGYSAYWLARGMAPGAALTVTDHDTGNIEACKKNLSQFSKIFTIHFIQGDALEVLSASDVELDLVFCDVEKNLYPKVIDPIARRLRPGGLFLTDNTLWNGRVAEKEVDDTTKAIQVFNRLMMRDARFQTALLPIRDGVAMAIRLPD